MKFKYSLLFLLMLGLLSSPTLAEGNGEVSLTSENSLYMSYDTEVREANASMYAWSNEGYNIYFTETDTLISVNLTIEEDMLYFHLGRNPNRTDSIDRHAFYICFENPVRELRRFETTNNGGHCRSDLIEYAIGDIVEGYDYGIRLPRTLDGRIPYHEWFIGEGAGGGGGCSCLPTTTNVVVSIAGVDSSYLVQVQDSIGKKIQYSGTPSGCSGNFLETKYRPDSTWLDLPIGASENWGADVMDSNGVNTKISNPAHNVGYWRPLETQQLDDDVDILINHSCPGSVWDGVTSPISQSSIYHGYHRITTNFTNHSNWTEGTIPIWFLAEDESKHLTNITIYINGTLNDTQTSIYDLNFTLNHTFEITFPPGNYEMYGRTDDVIGLNNVTGVYYFTVWEAPPKSSEDFPPLPIDRKFSPKTEFFWYPLLILVIPFIAKMKKKRKK